MRKTLMGFLLSVAITAHADSLRPDYHAYLWSWMANLCDIVEILFLQLSRLLNHAWGLSIIALALLLKFSFLPLQQWVKKIQQEVKRCEAILKPKFKSIKEKYDGEEAHTLMMAEYKQLGITPFYAMKPLIGTLLQLPFQVAIFNVLWKLPELQGVSLGWINDLTQPDPVLLVVMTLASIIATYLMPPSTNKLPLYAMAIAFFVLFYPFPAAMVLFWASMNVIHLGSVLYSNYLTRSPAG